MYTFNHLLLKTIFNLKIRSGISEDFSTRDELVLEVLQLQNEALRLLNEKKNEKAKKAEQLTKKRDREAKDITDAAMKYVKGENAFIYLYRFITNVHYHKNVAVVSL